jgi:hypothetical protein
MRRRVFLCGSVVMLGGPLAAAAQPARKYRLGWLSPASES